MWEEAGVGWSPFLELHWCKNDAERDVYA